METNIKVENSANKLKTDAHFRTFKSRTRCLGPVESTTYGSSLLGRQRTIALPSSQLFAGPWCERPGSSLENQFLTLMTTPTELPLSWALFDCRGHGDAYAGPL